MKLHRLAATIASSLAIAAGAAPALAATQPASGTFDEFPETITSEQFAGGNEIYTLTRKVRFTGTYDGSGIAEQRIVIRPDGSATLQMTIGFTGRVCGVRNVSLTWNVSGTVDFVANTFSGSYAVVGPSSLRGSGTFTGVPGTGGTYDGAINCG